MYHAARSTNADQELAISRIPRIRDVAERAGVSVGWVSTYLNSPGQIGTERAARIQLAIDELGFVRNDAARQLKRGTSLTIAYVAFDVGDPFSYMVARGARRRAADDGYRLVLADTEGELPVERDYLNLFEEQRVRGILLSSVTNDEVFDESTIRTPLVMIDYKTSRGGLASVSVNNVLGGELAAGHLLDQGRTRIAFVGGPITIQQVSDRLRGALNVVGAHGDAQLEIIETTQRDAQAGRDVAAKILARPPGQRPDGIFCVNDTVAVGMLQRFTIDPTYRVPDDVAVIGYNDVGLDMHPILPLSSIRQPHELLGRTAVGILIDEVSVPKVVEHQHVVFDPELVARQSTVGADPARE